jgi:hypothetical protein
MIMIIFGSLFDDDTKTLPYLMATKKIATIQWNPKAIFIWTWMVNENDPSS